MEFYNFLKKQYSEDTPIFISEIEYKDFTKNNIRQQIMRLSEKNLLARYDTGIYYIPKKSFLNTPLPLSPAKVIEAKYLTDGKNQTGYYSGLQFANKIGLTTQVPMVSQVVSNKATNEVRLIQLGDFSVQVRRPKIKVTNKNYKAIQLLDLICQIEKYSDLKGKELNTKILDYMKKTDLDFSTLEKYFKYYPDKLYKNLYKVGLINGVVA